MGPVTIAVDSYGPVTDNAQSVYELSDGSGLVLTVARYLTPTGHNIDREGLHPDFAKIPNAEAASARLAACRVPPRNPAAI